MKFLELFKLEILLAKLEINRSYQARDNNTLVLGSYKDVNVGTAFCSEILSPRLYAKLTQKGAHVLINLSSSGLFHESKILHTQMVQMTKVRAVENNRYLARSANLSPAFAVDNTGRLIAETPWGKTEVLYSLCQGN